ncbi:uncharacterized protein LOC119568771, partial [Penaeus monodon]|uniref:uncharacterized protein LOC119568771 n=1 Tax=Penaeus monodon TaxID=6687 RepID=UPI0018A72D83
RAGRGSSFVHNDFRAGNIIYNESKPQPFAVIDPGPEFTHPYLCLAYSLLLEEVHGANDPADLRRGYGDVSPIDDSRCSHRTVIATAGAGSSALSHLLSVAGASRTLLESIVPYSQAAFDDFLGKPPKQYVSDDAARLLAGRAYTRASQLERGDFPLVGLSCTATIVTDRHKKGEHRGFVATWQPHQLNTYSIVLKKGERNRAEEEAIYSLIMINALATACGLSAQIPLPLHGDEVVEATRYDFAVVTQQLHDQAIPFFALHDNGRIRTTDVCPQTILSGSFNPLHAGHLGMAHAASQLLDRPVAFELSAFNVDKPPIPPRW